MALKPNNLEFDRVTKQYPSPMVSSSVYCCFLKFPKLNFWCDITAFASLRVSISSSSAHFTKITGEDLLSPGMWAHLGQFLPQEMETLCTLCHNCKESRHNVFSPSDALFAEEASPTPTFQYQQFSSGTASLQVATTCTAPCLWTGFYSSYSWSSKAPMDLFIPRESHTFRDPSAVTAWGRVVASGSQQSHWQERMHAL